MKRIGLYNCTPEVVSADGAEITLRFPEGEEERVAFEAAIAETKLSPAEHADRHARQFGLPPYGPGVVSE